MACINDCKRLKEAAKKATSIKDLERETGLSYAMINTTLSKHPTIFKRIKTQLVINQEKAELELQKKREQEKKEKKKLLKMLLQQMKQVKKRLIKKNILDLLLMHL